MSGHNPAELRKGSRKHSQEAREHLEDERVLFPMFAGYVCTGNASSQEEAPPTLFSQQLEFILRTLPYVGAGVARGEQCQNLLAEVTLISRPFGEVKS